jgi:hypothetical protein
VPAAFFEGDALAREIYEAVVRALERAGAAEVRVGRSQIGFRRRHPFGAVWIPARYLSGRTAPLVLSVFLHDRDPSPRWKEVVEPATGRFTHHLELWAPQDVDEEVAAWLRRAWEQAA